MLQPPRYEVDDLGGLRGAATRLLLMGLPFAAVFAGVAAVRPSFLTFHQLAHWQCTFRP